MEIDCLIELPFYGITNAQLNDLFLDRTERWNNIFIHNELHEYVKKLMKDEEFRNLNFKYSSEDDFNVTTYKLKKLCCNFCAAPKCP